MLGEFADGVAGGLELYRRRFVVAVEVLVEGVHPAVPVGDAVGVQHWDEEEDEVLAQEVGARVGAV